MRSSLVFEEIRTFECLCVCVYVFLTLYFAFPAIEAALANALVRLRRGAVKEQVFLVHVSLSASLPCLY